ncbi:uncharacterized protein OCT59_015448 [Rhizophagus irregularis]|uniref:uncharacterized protein n=1 Tax=Rhizophagus irregularis TaxID=588596 RepID=UPI00332C049E|nr:hypothetical protein OCT59_015448 [Rhizophagus irregularis]
MSRLSSNIILDEWFNKIVPKPINNRPGYDMKYVSTYIVNYCYSIDLKKIIGIEWKYDTLSVVKPGFGNGKMVNSDYNQPRINKSNMAICFDCWKLEAVRNDNTLKEKKFLNIPSGGIRCTVNLDIWYSIDGLYRPYHVLQDQLYDYISYSKHKRHQLSDRLAIARNKIQCNYITPSAPNFEPAYISPARQEMIPPTSYQSSNCKSDTSEIFISSWYVKQNNLLPSINHFNQPILRLKDGTKIMIV